MEKQTLNPRAVAWVRPSNRSRPSASLELAVFEFAVKTMTTHFNLKNLSIRTNPVREIGAEARKTRH